MAMIAIVSIPPVMSVLPHTGLRSSAREVAASLREARSRAIFSNAEVVFSVDVDRHLFQISGDKRAHPLPSDVKLSLYTAQQELLGDSLGNIRFFPDGSSTGGRVALTTAGNSYYVTVNWLSGNVEILD
jgi:general secretion pathway protein H